MFAVADQLPGATTSVRTGSMDARGARFVPAAGRPGGGARARGEAGAEAHTVGVAQGPRRGAQLGLGSGRRRGTGTASVGDVP